jgi:hypothetical protein
LSIILTCSQILTALQSDIPDYGKQDCLIQNNDIAIKLSDEPDNSGRLFGIKF